jgi:hypothetical protein
MEVAPESFYWFFRSSQIGGGAGDPNHHRRGLEKPFRRRPTDRRALSIRIRDRPHPRGYEYSPGADRLAPRRSKHNQTHRPDLPDGQARPHDRWPSRALPAQTLNSGRRHQHLDQSGFSNCPERPISLVSRTSGPVWRRSSGSHSVGVSPGDESALAVPRRVRRRGPDLRRSHRHLPHG